MIFEKQILDIFKSNLYVRQDPTGDIFYFSHTDFPGLCASPFEFRGDKGQKLVGNFYYYGAERYDRLIIFDHGMGNGHVAYMKEIERLAKAGYTVLSYDHTGCRMSEGEHIGGFAQSLCDLDHCVKAVKNTDEYKNASISVVGHSWGAFSTMNIGALHPDITHLVALAGFISVRGIISQFLGGLLCFYRDGAYKIESESNPDYVEYDARTSLMKTEAKLLIFHSSDDKMVSVKKHFELLKKALKDRPKTELILVNGKGHNPNYTRDAVKYKDEFSASLARMRKAGELDTEEKRTAFVKNFDWDRMTAQDDEIWAKIISHLES